MAVSFSSPVVKDNSVSVVLTSDADLLSVNSSDFSLRRVDTNAIISSSGDVKVAVAARTGSNYNWNITITNSTNYAGDVFVRARSDGFIERVGFARVPTSNLDTSHFRFVVAPPAIPTPTTPTNFAVSTIDTSSVRLTFSASTPTVTQYQYRYATSEAALSSATWQDGGTSTTIVVKGLSADTLIYFQVRAVNQTEYSAASPVVSARTAAPPPPVEPVTIQRLSAPLKILIDTPFELRLKITGHPSEVRVTGDLQFWDYEFKDPILRVWVTFKKQFTGLFTISAVDPNDDTNIVLQDVVYDVVLPAPIISDMVLPPVVEGYPYRAFIPIVNQGTTKVSGLFTGLGYDNHTLGRTNTTGVLIYGDPAVADRTVETGRFIVTDESDGQMDKKDFLVNIEDVSFENLYVLCRVDGSDDPRIIAIPKNTGLAETNQLTVTPVPSLIMNILEEYLSDQVGISSLTFAELGNELYFMGINSQLRSPYLIYQISKTDSAAILIKNFSYETGEILADQNPGSPTLVNSVTGYGDELWFELSVGSFNFQNSPSYLGGFSVNNIETEEVIEGHTFAKRIPQGFFKFAVDADYIYGLAYPSSTPGRLILYRFDKSTGGGERQHLLHIVPDNIIVGFAVDDNYIFILSIGTQTIYRYAKSGLSWDGSVVSNTGAIIGPPNGFRFDNDSIAATSG